MGGINGMTRFSGAHKPSIAPAYAVIVPMLAHAARPHGYAVAVHGSLQRDLDLVAIPWVEDAADPHVLVEALQQVCKGKLIGPEQKPHGRLAWSIVLAGGAYVDLSVMPCS